MIDAASDEHKKQQPDTAIFYSISNCQTGLAGISFGNFLIKQVADAVKKEFPGITQFATLSPIPGFRKWLDDVLVRDTPDWLNEDDIDLLNRSDWRDNELIRQPLKPALINLCARYLVEKNAMDGPSTLSPAFIWATVPAWNGLTGQPTCRTRGLSNQPA